MSDGTHLDIIGASQEPESAQEHRRKEIADAVAESRRLDREAMVKARAALSCAREAHQACGLDSCPLPTMDRALALLDARLKEQI